MFKYGVEWDPLSSPDWDLQNPTTLCLQRTKRDLQEILESDSESLIFIQPTTETDITRFTSVILGPVDTPYEGGVFRFAGRVPPNYPLSPPRIRSLTTDAGQVRFGPNFYTNGKVCLSTIGTWVGPGWTVTQSILSTLQSIQSLLTANALKNEPGYAALNEGSRELASYDSYIRHETIRVAIVKELRALLSRDQTLLSPENRKKVFRNFLDVCDRLLEVCVKSRYLDGKSMETWPRQFGGVFDFAGLRGDLLDIRGTVQTALIEEENM